MDVIEIRTKKRNQMVDITKEVQSLVYEKKLHSGYIILYVPHTTAAVTINEGADPSVKKDLIKKLSELIPEKNGYSHVEGNSDAHIKTSLLGCSQLVLVENSELLLGTWQHIFLFEGDGPRTRRIFVKMVSC